jgi:hypothetical protein
MSDEQNIPAEQDHGVSPQADASQSKPGALGTGVMSRLPGLAAISLYMLFLAGTVILGVVLKRYPPVYLFFPVFFIAAGMGLLMQFRWAWALSLAAVVLQMGMFLYLFTTQHVPSELVQGLLNLVFFLYLVRPEVRAKLH